MSNDNNNNNIDLSNNKTVRNNTDGSLNIIHIDISDNIVKPKTNITRYYSINLMDNVDNHNNSNLDTSSNENNSIIENSKHIIPYNNKENVILEELKTDEVNAL